MSAPDMESHDEECADDDCGALFTPARRFDAWGRFDGYTWLCADCDRARLEKNYEDHMSDMS